MRYNDDDDDDSHLRKISFDLTTLPLHDIIVLFVGKEKRMSFSVLIFIGHVY